MRTHCPVCHGVGSIVNPKYYGKMWMGPVPTIECPNCQGEKFVGEPDVKHPLIPTDLRPYGGNAP